MFYKRVSQQYKDILLLLLKMNWTIINWLVVLFLFTDFNDIDPSTGL